MIRSFCHKGLKRLYEDGDAKGVRPEQAARLRRILGNLDQAQQPADLDLPGYRPHPLKGNRKGDWSITVSGNWRVTFRFEGTDVAGVDYEDYH
jgi:proteic killer suppression protein